MPAYLIARVQITHPERYPDYSSQTPGVVESFGGRFIARGGAFSLKEGNDPERNRVVVIEFPDREHAEAFYHSEAYQAILPIRQAAAVSELFIVDGV